MANPYKIYQVVPELYPHLVQIQGGNLYDGEGNLITVIGQIEGPKGETGPTGPQGFQGSTGPQGFQGSTGPQGFQGPTGPQGFQGSTGPQGFQGSTGPQGFQGSTGPSNHFTWGLTTSTYSIVLNSDYGPEYYGVSSSATSYVYLPSNVVVGKSLTIKDESGMASIYPIYIVATNGEKIDNNADVQLSINYGSLTLLRRNNNWWII